MPVGRLVADAVADVDAHGLGGAHESRNLDDALLGDARDGSGPSGRELLDMLGQLIEAEAPVLDEVVIVEILADNDIQERKCEGAVGAGNDGQPVIGMGAQALLHGANVDNRHAALLGIKALGGIALVDGGVLGVVTPYDEQLAFVELLGSGIGGSHVSRTADRHQAREHALGVADSGMQIVRGAVHVQETAAKRAEHRIVLGGQHAVGFGAVLLFLLLQLRGDLVERLIPGDLLELALALLAGALHGIQQAVRGIHGVHSRIALGAQRLRAAAVVVASLGVALDVRPTSVFDRAQGGAVGASGAAHLAPGVLDFDNGLGGFLTAGFGKFIVLECLWRAASEHRRSTECGSPLEQCASCEFSHKTSS